MRAFINKQILKCQGCFGVVWLCQGKIEELLSISNFPSAICHCVAGSLLPAIYGLGGPALGYVCRSVTWQKVEGKDRTFRIFPIASLVMFYCQISNY